MRRRDFVKGVVAVPVAASTALGQQAPSSPSAPPTGAAPAAPPTAPQSPITLRGAGGFKTPPISSVVPDVVAETDLHFFTQPQLAALRRLSDLFMPAREGYPSALQAQAAEFLDFLVSASLTDRQSLYRQGLDHLNLEAKKRFGKSFADLDAQQADKVVRPGLVPYMREFPPEEGFPRFIAISHDDIRTATMNSEQWNVAAVSSGERAPGVGMFWRPIDPDRKFRV